MTLSERNQPNACPVTYALEIFGDRWTLLVLRDVLLEGRHRYKDVLAANPGLATNILTDRLKRLEKRGLLERRKDPQDGRQYLYLPTEQAVSLIPMLLEMVMWSFRSGGVPLPEGFEQRFDRDRTDFVAELQDKARSSRAKL